MFWLCVGYWYVTTWPVRRIDKAWAKAWEQDATPEMKAAAADVITMARRDMHIEASDRNIVNFASLILFRQQPHYGLISAEQLAESELNLRRQR